MTERRIDGTIGPGQRILIATGKVCSVDTHSFFNEACRVSINEG
jgi:hypothetical protein